MVAGSPMSGIGGLFYIVMFLLGILMRLYKSNKRITDNSNTKYMGTVVLIFVFFMILLTIINFYIINLSDVVSKIAH